MKYINKNEQKLFGFLTVDPLLLFHYVLLEILIVLFFVNTQLTITLNLYHIILLYLLLWIGDSVIHLVIGKD